MLFIKKLKKKKQGFYISLNNFTDIMLFKKNAEKNWNFRIVFLQNEKKI